MASSIKLSIDQEILLLQFWALSVEIARQLPPRTCQAINGLQVALDKAASIPASIGWEDDVNAAAARSRGDRASPLGRRRA